MNDNYVHRTALASLSLSKRSTMLKRQMFEKVGKSEEQRKSKPRYAIVQKSIPRYAKVIIVQKEAPIQAPQWAKSLLISRLKVVGQNVRTIFRKVFKQTLCLNVVTNFTYFFFFFNLLTNLTKHFVVILF